jgi:hypothetical protein
MGYEVRRGRRAPPHAPAPHRCLALHSWLVRSPGRPLCGPLPLRASPIAASHVVCAHVSPALLRSPALPSPPRPRTAPLLAACAEPHVPCKTDTLHLVLCFRLGGHSSAPLQQDAVLTWRHLLAVLSGHSRPTEMLAKRLAIVREGRRQGTAQGSSRPQGGGWVWPHRHAALEDATGGLGARALVGVLRVPRAKRPGPPPAAHCLPRAPARWAACCWCWRTPSRTARACARTRVRRRGGPHSQAVVVRCTPLPAASCGPDHDLQRRPAASCGPDHAPAPG